MSATISWTPVKPGKSLPVMAPSSFIEMFTEAFGEYPWNLGEKHLDILRGMRAADRNWHKAIDEIQEAITKYGAIVIDVSY